MSNMLTKLHATERVKLMLMALEAGLSKSSGA